MVDKDQIFLVIGNDDTGFDCIHYFPPGIFVRQTNSFERVNRFHFESICGTHTQVLEKKCITNTLIPISIPKE